MFKEAPKKPLNVLSKHQILVVISEHQEKEVVQFPSSVGLWSRGGRICSRASKMYKVTSLDY